MRGFKFISVIGILLLFYIIWKTGIGNLLSAFSAMNYSYLPVILFLLIPLVALQAYKWNYLLRRQKINLNFLYVIKLQIISTFYELITPARIGSFIKIAYLQDRTHNLGKSSSSVVIDRALDFLVVALLAFIGSLSLISKKFNAVYACLVIFILFTAGFIVLLNKNATKFFAKIFYNVLLPEKFRNRAKKSFDDFYKSMPSIKDIIYVFMVTLIFWVLVYTQAYLIALSFSIKISYIKFLVIFPISIIISLVPITISGFGAREAVLLALLGGYAEKQNIVAFSIAWAALSLIIYPLLAILFIFKKEKKHPDIKR
jgi:uncharacterized protein (TIRG00374 family)